MKGNSRFGKSGYLVYMYIVHTTIIMHNIIYAQCNALCIYMALYQQSLIPKKPAKRMVSGEVGTIVTAPMLTGHLGVTGVTIVIAPVLTGHMPVVGLRLIQTQ